MYIFQSWEEREEERWGGWGLGGFTLNLFSVVETALPLAASQI